MVRSSFTLSRISVIPLAGVLLFGSFLCFHNQLNDLVKTASDGFLHSFKGSFQSARREPSRNETEQSDTKKDHVAIIVPYRNRPLQLYQFLAFMPTFLRRKKQLHFRIYIVNQTDEFPFNRGMLLNAGFKEAQMENPWDCLIFHDVDLLPLNETNTYSCSKDPLLMASRMDKWGWELPYAGYFGGVATLLVKQFEQVNGFSNMFWGWGAEDDDMQRRLRFHGLPIGQLDKEGFYTMTKHAQEPMNEQRVEMLNQGSTRYAWDGLNNLTYSLVSQDVLEKCSILQVRLERGAK